MTAILTPMLTAHWDDPDSFTLNGYRRTGGYQALPRALGMGPEEVVRIVKDSGLRGRGGAGFPVGVKWGFIPLCPPTPRQCQARRRLGARHGSLVRLSGASTR